VTSQGIGRRAEYAAATRQAILLAARELFVEQGYFDTRVEDIARAARVAVPTVYAAVGGKSGLLRTLIQEGVAAAEAGDIHARIAAHTDPDALLRMIVDGTCAAFETWSPLTRPATAAAPQDAGVRESLGEAHASLRRGLTATATRLAELDSLRPGMTADQAADILWYFLGNASYFTLTDDCQWPLSRSADWLRECLTAALFSVGRST
jgi:AcrR family transcriptional regulator